ncbi:lysogeny maintenance protein PflM [Ectopseudomonas mendocina]|uniref:lysogeny maintenance protein PflM n=2 Tax=Ectopseudomonas mendocina TaxID=300 RepID=UPI001561525C
MKSLSQYVRQPHADNCDCSVCWSRRAMAQPEACPSTPCSHCRPVHVSRDLLTGRWQVKPAFICAKHKPPRRPPAFWSVAFQSSTSVPTDEFPF